MLEYAPWSNRELKRALDLYKNQQFSILDFELGGGCNYHCRYCDSPERPPAGQNKVEIFSHLSNQMPLAWIYVCGIGEPTFGENGVILKELLQRCSEKQIRCSSFTNASFVSDEMMKHVRTGTLNLLFKFDSLNSKIIRHLYGTDNPSSQIENIHRLCSSVHVSGGVTNLAASIVPTRKNIRELPALLDFCDQHGVFPLVAELEDSGRGADFFNELALTKAELCDIQQMIKTRYGLTNTPFCPSAIAGIHIANDNSVVVDERTGLSCHWFWNEAPRIKNLGPVSTQTPYQEIQERVMDYRDQKLAEAAKIRDTRPVGPMGGCGGDVSKLLDLYTSVHRRVMNTSPSP